MSQPQIVTFLFSHLYYLPYLGIYLFGMGFSIARWKRHPKISLLTTIAFSIFLIQWIVSITMSYLFLRAAFRNENLQSISFMQGFSSIFISLAEFSGWVLILFALFSIKGKQEIAPNP